jgi:hypothetical protein
MRNKRNWAIGVLAGAAASVCGAAPAVAHESGNLRSLVSDLYGGDGITLTADPQVVGHAAHFTAESTEQLNNLSNVVSSNIGVFTFNSTVSAISFDLEEGVPVRSQESLGPSLAERATTIGRGKVNVAASYANIDYRQLNGTDLDSLSIVLGHIDIPPVAIWEADTITLDLDLSIKQEVLAFFGTYGLTDNLDVGIVIPLVSIDATVRSVATIDTTYCTPETISGIGCVAAATPAQGIAVHRFADGFNPVDVNSGSATGVGDILLRAKWHAFGGADSAFDGGVLAQAQLATGDETDLLGTGSSAIAVIGVLSGEFGALNPHINAGYEHYFDQDEGASGHEEEEEEDHHGGGAQEVDRSNWRAVAGFDIRARDNLAFSTEFLGRWEDDGDRFYDLALGGKWAPGGRFPLNLNVLFPLNRDEGLRPDYIFSFGFEATF